MSVIPPEHDACAVWVARFHTDRRADSRAFSSSHKARSWVDDCLEQDIDWYFEVRFGTDQRTELL